MMLSYNERPSVHRMGGPASRATMGSMSMSNVNNGVQSGHSEHHRHIWIITGPAGCGKTTVAKYIAEKLNIPYIEGDEYHPPANIKKMAEGQPLTDEDRWDWLVLLRKKAVERLTSTQAPGVVLTCSALKHKYRDVIRLAAYYDHDVIVHFVFLRADEQILIQRVRARKGHYMKDSMVHSQMVALEEPEEDERDCLSVDVSGSLTQVQRETLGMVQETLAEDS